MRARVIVLQANLVGHGVFLTDHFGQSLQLGIQLGSNQRIAAVLQNGPSFHGLHLSRKVSAFHRPGTGHVCEFLFAIEDPYFISSDNYVQPVKGATSREHLSANLQAS